MFKKIRVGDACVGMYVQKLEGSWLDHAFWKSSFAISNEDILNKLRACGVQEIWIDTRRGHAVSPAPGQVAPVATEMLPLVASEVASEVARAPNVHPAVDGGVFDWDAADRSVARAPPNTRTLCEEITQAARVIETGKRVVVEMLAEARLGRLNMAEAHVLVEEITQSVSRNADAFISVARLKSRDEYTYLHSVAVCALMVALARQLGWPDAMVRVAGFAGLVHDIGKVAIPDGILNKASALTDEEFRIVMGHPEAGANLLALDASIPVEVLDVCLHHHERMDGKGYPHALAGENLTTLVKMGAICDVYDAVTSDRPYKRAWPAAEAIKRMTIWAGPHFDVRLFKAFVKAVGIYPIGTLVKLSNQRLAVVVTQGRKSLLTPEVLAFYSITGGTRIIPEKLDLAARPETILSVEDPAQWGVEDLETLWKSAPD